VKRKFDTGSGASPLFSLLCFDPNLFSPLPEILQDPQFVNSFWELFYFLCDIATMDPSKIYPRKSPLSGLFVFQDNFGKKVILHHDLVFFLMDRILEAFPQKADLASSSLTTKETHKLLTEILDRPYRPKPIGFVFCFFLLHSPFFPLSLKLDFFVVVVSLPAVHSLAGTWDYHALGGSQGKISDNLQKIGEHLVLWRRRGRKHSHPPELDEGWCGTSASQPRNGLRPLVRSWFVAPFAPKKAFP